MTEQPGAKLRAEFQFDDPSSLWSFLRATMGLTQEEFGEQIGLSRRTVQRYEAGIVQIPAEDLFLALKACGYAIALEPVEPPPLVTIEPTEISWEDILAEERKKRNASPS